MNQYYEILGLNPGASGAEIKKAYFKLIRQYSPESDPEKFQEIRHAYEFLQNPDKREAEPEFPPLSDSFARKMLEQIEKSRHMGNKVLFRDTCEEAWKRYPGEIRFLYLLVNAQRQCGNTGKAVKNAEKLVEIEPENRWFQRELAYSYMERGYTKKAYPVCEKAYEMGWRDTDFIMMFSHICESCDREARAFEILFELLTKKDKWTREELPDLFEVIAALFYLGIFVDQSCFTDYLDELYSTLKHYKVYLADYAAQIAALMTARGYMLTDEPNRAYAEQILELLREICRDREDGEAIDQFLEEFKGMKFLDDDRFSETMQSAYEAYFILDQSETKLARYAQTDVKLCMIEEREEILGQIDFIRQDYPQFYEKMKDFWEKLKNGNSLSYLKDSLKKDYERLDAECSGGSYYVKYPQEKPSVSHKVIATDQTYIRDGKKIGRNDPCPCGSGKKYKQCCMNK